MIVRHGPGDYERVEKKPKLTQRRHDDYDLAANNVRIYVLGEREWFDPGTSSKYDDNGVSRHAMYGPAVVAQEVGTPCCRTACHYVNDPRAWAFVRHLIVKGLISAEAMPGVPHHYADVTIRQPQKKSRTR